MPRTMQDILDHAHDRRRRFEDYAPESDDRPDAASLVAVREAVLARAEVEKRLATAVTDAVARTGAARGTHGRDSRMRSRTEISSSRPNSAVRSIPRICGARSAR